MDFWWRPALALHAQMQYKVRPLRPLTAERGAALQLQRINAEAIDVASSRAFVEVCRRIRGVALLLPNSSVLGMGIG